MLLQRASDVPSDAACPGLCQQDRECMSMGPSAMYCMLNDPVTGCELQGTCEVPTSDINGYECPINCPVLCGPEEQLCIGAVQQDVRTS